MQEILSKISIGNRIRGLRLKAGLSQAEVAQNLKVSRSNYSQIELGNQFPTFEVLCRIASFYSKTYEWILHGSALRKEQEQEGFPFCRDAASYHTALNNDKTGNIILVRYKNRTDYVSNLTDPDFLNRQEVFFAPFLKGTRSVRAFEVEGNSMRNALYHGDILISRQILNPEDIVNQSVYVLVTESEIIIERIVVSNRATGVIVCVSDIDPLNRRTISFSELKEIWKAEGKYSKVLSRMIENVNGYISRLESSVFDLQQQVEEIKRTITQDTGV